MLTGCNGSGKSAILAALCVALGGNPGQHSHAAGGSGRATQGLIQEGKDWARVELTLLNRASDVFDGQDLGQRVVVTYLREPRAACLSPPAAAWCYQ